MVIESFLLACGYGFFMGSYPVPIRAPSVLAANIHPLIFQSYKSSWVLVTGARSRERHFSWWQRANR